MAKEQKDITTLDVQIAEFIRSHKKSGTATDDEINDQVGYSIHTRCRWN